MAQDNSSMTGTFITAFGAIFGKIFLWAGAADLSFVSNVVAIVVGLVTLFINWPRIRQRVTEVKNKLFKK